MNPLRCTEFDSGTRCVLVLGHDGAHCSVLGGKSEWHTWHDGPTPEFFDVATAIVRQRDASWKTFDALAKALGQHCSRCDFDEAEGDLVSHCDACCRKIVTDCITIATIEISNE